MNIRVLPGNLANMIAAGEVVQRPASVVKELVENAVDAGADRIDVSIVDGGRTLIQVIDNGCGMSPDDAVLCFERHATSKLATEDDLQNILTFGFRGEALASIAAIAEVTLRTRREEDETACEVRMAASRQTGIEQAAGPKGTKFAVRNLFYNVPARRKYLKSDAVEFKHIVEEFQRVALTRYDLSFSLSHNGKDVLVLPAARTLKQRIRDVFSDAVTGELLDFSVQTNVAGISGFVGKPESARKGQACQFFFVNGRYFRSPYLTKAVLKSYEGLIPEGMTPAYFIYITVPPYSVDVNVSPTKTEIKFEEDSIIFQTLFASLKGVLGKQNFSDTLDFEGARATQIPKLNHSFGEYKPLPSPDKTPDDSYNPFETDGFPNEPDFLQAPSSARTEYSPQRPSSAVEPHQDYGKLFDDRPLASVSVLVLQGKYILTQLSDGLIIVHVYRARLRILYEKYLSILSKNSHSTQIALFETTVTVGVENALLIEDKQELLSRLGFDIRLIGNDTVVVGGVPEGFSAYPGDVAGMVDGLLDILKDRTVTLEETMLGQLALRFAQAAVAGTAPSLNPVSAQRLVGELFACSDSEITPQGKKIYVRMPIDEIERKF